MRYCSFFNIKYSCNTLENNYILTDNQIYICYCIE